MCGIASILLPEVYVLDDGTLEEGALEAHQITSDDHNDHVRGVQHDQPIDERCDQEEDVPRAHLAKNLCGGPRKASRQRGAQSPTTSQLQNSSTK
jgi:hypothetical protein